MTGCSVDEHAVAPSRPGRGPAAAPAFRRRLSALGDQARFEQHPQAQGDIGILAGIFGGLVEGHLGEGLLRVPGPATSLKCHGFMAEMALRQSSMPWP